MKQLTPYDFFALRVIEEQPGISVRLLHAAVNLVLEIKPVPAEYATPKRHKASMEVCLVRLRAAGLVEDHATQVRDEAVQKLWWAIGKSWRQWPWYIPIVNGHPDYINMRKRT